MSVSPQQPDQVETRLTNLEIKATYSEDLLDTLNQTVFSQQQQIDQLSREISSLRQQARDASARTGAGARDELPPHY